jgi:hypothetical protein
MGVNATLVRPRPGAANRARRWQARRPRFEAIRESALSSRVSYIVMLALSMIACLPSASADWQSGTTLLEHCVGQRILFCHGYIEGIIDMEMFVKNNLNLKGDFCIPKNVTAKQLVDIVTQYLNEHPVERRYTAASEVYIAITSAFPCPKN